METVQYNKTFSPLRVEDQDVNRNIQLIDEELTKIAQVLNVSVEAHTHDDRYYTEAEIDALLAAQDEFTELSDTPGAYAGQAGKYVKVNATPDALEFASILEADLPSNINAAKIADGSVSNTEFQYLDGVSSALQAQLNGKVPVGRLISTTAPLSGGGDLSANRTLSLLLLAADLGVDGSNRLYVKDSGIDHDLTTNFLIAEHLSLPNTIVNVLSNHTKAVHDALGLSHDSLVDVSVDDHHSQLHEAAHRSGGGDELNHDLLAGFLAVEHVSLPNTIANVLSDHNLAAHTALGLFDQSSDVDHDLTTNFLIAEHLSLPNTIVNVLSDHTKAVHDALALDHGALSGRGDDDHTIYSLASGARAFSGVVSGVDPTIAAHLATKNYVDTQIGGVADKLVGIDAAATPGYLGVASNNGVLRVNDPLTYADGGDFITLGVDVSYIDHGGLGGLGDDDHNQYYNAARHTKAVHDALGLDHDSLVGVSVDDHHAQSHTLASHSTKTHAELTGVTSDLHHAQLHETAHRSGGGDALNHDLLTGFVATEHVSLPNTIANVLSNHTKAIHDSLGLSHDSLVDVSVDDHHAQLHAASHHVGGGDLVNHDSLTGFLVAEHLGLPNTIVNVLSDHNKAVHDALNIDADTWDGYDSANALIEKTVIGGGADLDDYTTTGLYHQNSNADAGTGSHYPVALAGSLQVVADEGFVYQKYHVYGSGNTVWVRAYYSAAWSAWAEQWNSTHDGSGSGLGADLLDGQQGSYYAPTTTKLDDWATPDDNTDLNASLTRHGLLLKLGGGTVNFLRADGTWAAPGGGTPDPHAASHQVGGGDLINHDSLTGFVAAEHLLVGAIDHNSLLNYAANRHIVLPNTIANVLSDHNKAAHDALNIDADLLDALHATDLLRSNVDDNLTAAIIVPTGNRDEGIFGTYDSTKTQHIWSMGIAFRNSPSGANFGNLYGLAYKWGGGAGSHGVYLCHNGSAKVGLGTNVWTSGVFISTKVTGTAPFTVASTTKVTNLNADLLDGYNASQAAGNNTVVVRSGSGYIYCNYLNCTSGETADNPTHYFVEIDNDSFLRQMTAANFVSRLSGDGVLLKSGGICTGLIKARDHGAASFPEIVNLVYGTGSPPAAGGTPIGTLWVKYS